MATGFNFKQVIRREKWGAGLDLNRGWKRSKEKPTTLIPRGIVVHHFEPTSQFNQVGESTTEQRLRYWFTIHSDKWSDIGYHFLIGPAGRVYEGRRELDGKPIQGAHALGNNDRALGIALLGNYCDELPPESALASLEALILALCNRFALDPEDRENWNYVDDKGAYRQVLLPRIVGHCDVRGGTRCPGEMLYPKLELLRKKIAQALRQPPTGT